MRQRVLIVYVTLLVIAGLGFAVPLSSALASRATAAMVLDRTHDSARLAAIAEASVISGTAGLMTNELAVYERVYGIRAVVLDREGAVVAASTPGLDATAVTGQAQLPGGMPPVVLNALAGNRPGTSETLWPWDPGPLVVAEPVISSGEVIGVVVTASPTGALHRQTLVQWAWVAAGVAAMLAAGIAAAGPLARWVLRPIGDLDTASTAISHGDMDTRVPVDAGPPELRRLGESFNQMAETITTLIERQRTFVAYAGHQVRNPLAALRLRVEALGAQLAEPALADHALALEEVDRLARTCDSLLTLAQAEDADIEMVPVDLGEVASGRVRAWAPIAARAQTELRYLTGPAPTVQAIDGSIEQTLDALIDNALKFAGRGAVVQVEVGRPSEGSVELKVVDDGPGLPADQRDRAAEPFWTSGEESPGSAAGGSGLGLSIVVTLVALQGGRLELRPRAPHGTEAVVRLPISARASGPIPPPDLAGRSRP